jgi:hypothetical protein
LALGIALGPRAGALACESPSGGRTPEGLCAVRLPPSSVGEEPAKVPAVLLLEDDSGDAAHQLGGFVGAHHGEDLAAAAWPEHDQAGPEVGGLDHAEAGAGALAGDGGHRTGDDASSGSLRWIGAGRQARRRPGSGRLLPCWTAGHRCAGGASTAGAIRWLPSRGQAPDPEPSPSPRRSWSIRRGRYILALP